MTLLKSLAVIFSIAVISCCSGKKTATENSATETNNDITINTQKMMESGFSKASIVESKIEGDCPFTIKIEAGGMLLDPTNLDEGFKKHNEKIWVKYAGLRMMNRCEKANPVRIEAIQKRAE